MAKTIAVVCCSNGQSRKEQETIETLKVLLESGGSSVLLSRYLYRGESVYSGTAKERAEELMKYYQMESVTDILDISGGDIANEILLYLDFQVIAAGKKRFWGYSDVTTILNALYAKTGSTGVLYQARQAVYHRDMLPFFLHALHNDSFEKELLFDISYEWIQHNAMQGIVVGGNIRCLLKLAGTPYFPDMQGKILLLEANSGTTAQLVTYFSQLKMMGVFEKVAGVLLGTFMQMEREEGTGAVIAIAKRFVGKLVPLAKTQEIGHGVDSKAIIIGERMGLKDVHVNIDVPVQDCK